MVEQVMPQLREDRAQHVWYVQLCGAQFGGWLF